MFKVRSPLSLKRAISLIDDVMNAFNVSGNDNEIEVQDIELPIKEKFVPNDGSMSFSNEESEENDDNDEEEEEIEEPLEETPIINEEPQKFEENDESLNFSSNLIGKWKRNFGARLNLAGKEGKDNFNYIYCYILSKYNIKGRISDSGVKFSIHRDLFLRIKMSGKSLKLLFALNPDDYTDSPIPVKDLRREDKEVLLPLMFKVRSALSLKRAITLIDDVMLAFSVPNNGNEIELFDVDVPIKEKFIPGEGKELSNDSDQIEDENDQDDDEDNEEDIEEIAEPEEPIVEETPLPESSEEDDEDDDNEEDSIDDEDDVVIDDNAEVKTTSKGYEGEGKIIRNFGAKLYFAGDELKSTFDYLYSYILNQYKIKGRISDSGVKYNYHRDVFLKMKMGGKSLKLFFNLNPDDYTDSPIPVKDVRKEGKEVLLPLLFKVRSPLSVQRALILIDDVMSKLEIKKIDKELQINKIDVQVKEIYITSKEVDEDNELLKDNENGYISERNFGGKFYLLDKYHKNYYYDLRSYFTRCYPFRGKISNSGDTFYIDGDRYIKITVEDGVLQCYTKLNPQDYLELGIGVERTEIEEYEDLPTHLAINTHDDVENQKYLIDTMMKELGVQKDNNDYEISIFTIDSKEKRTYLKLRTAESVLEEKEEETDDIDALFSNEEEKEPEFVKSADELMIENGKDPALNLPFSQEEGPRKGSLASAGTYKKYVCKP